MRRFKDYVLRRETLDEGIWANLFDPNTRDYNRQHAANAKTVLGQDKNKVASNIDKFGTNYMTNRQVQGDEAANIKTAVNTLPGNNVNLKKSSDSLVKSLDSVGTDWESLTRHAANAKIPVRISNSP